MMPPTLNATRAAQGSSDWLSELVRRRSPGLSLERSFYTAADVFDVDIERVWSRNWIFAGHTARIPERGDYFTIEIGQESLIVARDERGGVGALFNTCRHRGSRVCMDASGRARVLVCPYHQWTYGLDGTLLSARHMPAGLDKSGLGLRRAHARVTQGLIFVCLDEPALPFDAFEELIGPRLRHYELDQARIAARETYIVGANWKLVVENSRECYHCGAGHPQYCRAVGFAAAIDSRDGARDDASAAERRRALLESAGMESDPVPFQRHTWFNFRRFFLRGRILTESMDGQPVAPLMGRIVSYEVGVCAVVGLPNLLLEVSPDYAMSLAFFPLDSGRTRAEVTWLVRGDARAGVDYNLGKLMEFWRLTCEQDWKLCEGNQAGVNSHRYQPGPYAPDEGNVEHFARWYLDQLDATA